MEGRVTITDSRMKTAQVTVILTCWIISKNILPACGSRNFVALEKKLEF